MVGSRSRLGAGAGALALAVGSMAACYGGAAETVVAYWPHDAADGDGAVVIQWTPDDGGGEDASPDGVAEGTGDLDDAGCPDASEAAPADGTSPRTAATEQPAPGGDAAADAGGCPGDAGAGTVSDAFAAPDGSVLLDGAPAREQGADGGPPEAGSGGLLDAAVDARCREWSGACEGPLLQRCCLSSWGCVFGASCGVPWTCLVGCP